MERALLVTVDLGVDANWTAEERSAELKELALSAGARITREEIVKRQTINPALYIGSGKAAELSRIVADEGINIVIFNNDLTGTQQKNLEDVVHVKTIDRTQLILDIFARRAHTNEGKLQVELAQLMYMLPRLMGKGIILSRLGGGIGTRGPGEQKLEVDRRRIRTKIAHLKRDLNELEKRRAMMRNSRKRYSLLTVALVGYTNSGKSTLLNALTNSDVLVRDKLFATLDPTIRKFIMPNKQKVLFIDTVGFLKDLPHNLIEAFKATLEEVVEADLLVHLVDGSHPKAKEQSDAVYRVLEEIGASGKKMITVINKIDKVSQAKSLERIESSFDSPIEISAIKKKGLERLIDRIAGHLRGLTAIISLSVLASDAKTVNMIHENGYVRKTKYKGDRVIIEAEVPLRIKHMLEKTLDN